MPKRSASPVIRLRGVRQNNLKQFDLELPLGRLIVITGLSGSGKSSLAFDTLFAEGQRRYIETFSPYARQFFDRMDKPQVDVIEGIPPAIAIEQRNTVRTTRSTVGTMTEICDYVKNLWPYLAQLYCRQCGRRVCKETPAQIWESLQRDLTTQSEAPSEILIAFQLPLTEKLSLAESLDLISKQGYQRLLVPVPEELEIVPITEAATFLQSPAPQHVTIVQDRVSLQASQRPRFVEACEQAYHFGKGKLLVYSLYPAPDAPRRVPVQPRPFSNRFHCATCDMDYREPVPALFSFNHPLGACPVCHGFGRTITIDYQRALPDHTKTLAEGVVKPWQSGMSAECQDDLMRFCHKRKVPTDVPFNQLPAAQRDWVLNGDPGYGQDKQHEWPQAWYGVKGYFRWLESKAYKMHVRVLLSRYRAYQPCPECHGKRFQPEALLYKISTNNTIHHGNDSAALESQFEAQLSLADFYQMPIRTAYEWVERLAAQHHALPSDPLGLVLTEVRSRLGYLAEVGLGYLTLDRPTRSLSGGETERVNLTTCLGTHLVNTLFVLDEPSVGLHPRDTHRLVRILQALREVGNTVVVVEHEPSVMRAADQIVDLGPGSGEAGGHVVFQGAYSEILRCAKSITGQYLAGTQRIPLPSRRECAGQSTGRLKLKQATLHNLQNLAVDIPLNRFVCITGVSGSGKTTLVRDLLLPFLSERLVTDLAKDTSQADTNGSEEASEQNGDEEHDSLAPTSGEPTIQGWEALGRVLLVDQSSLGKTPRSNPAVYIGAFADLRELFAQSELARQRGLGASAFSFNSAQGQCERCRGAGFEKIEMQFLSDIYVRCPDCNGRRYRPHIIEIKIRPPITNPIPKKSVVSGQWSVVKGTAAKRAVRSKTARLPKHDLVVAANIANSSWSIADLLEATVDDTIRFLEQFTDSRPAQRAARSLKLLQEVGLGYLRVGQPINTLSGGESQRLKLVRHLAEFAQAQSREAKPTLFLFDEPTTGLHFDDIRVLLQVFQRLVDSGHSVLIIEHNLEVIKCADWLIDLGPEAGDLGGHIVTQGTPEQVAACPESHTGQALRENNLL